MMKCAHEALLVGWINVMQYHKKREMLWGILRPGYGSFALYEEKPKTLEEERDVSQWIFGGCRALRSVNMKEERRPVRGNGNALRFCITLETSHPRKDAEVHRIFFSTEIECKEWFEAMAKTKACQLFIDACLEIKAQPIAPIFDLLLNPQISALDVHHVLIGRPAIKAIAAFGNIFGRCSKISIGNSSSYNVPLPKRISLVNTGIGSFDIKFIGKFLSASRRLETLILSQNSIDDEGLSLVISAIGLNYNLRVLVLDRNLISDAGATRLGHYIQHSTCPLQCLNVADNRIRRLGAYNLLNGISKNRRLRSTLLELSVGYNELGDHSMEILARLFAEEDGASSLMTIDVSNAMLGNTGIEWLIWGISKSVKLKEIDLRGNLSSASVLSKLVLAVRWAHIQNRKLLVRIGGSCCDMTQRYDAPLLARDMLNFSARKMIGNETRISRLLLRRQGLWSSQFAPQNEKSVYFSMALNSAPSNFFSNINYHNNIFAQKYCGSFTPCITSTTWCEWLTELHAFMDIPIGHLKILSATVRKAACKVSLESLSSFSSDLMFSQIRGKIAKIATFTFVPFSIVLGIQALQLSEPAVSSIAHLITEKALVKRNKKVNEERNVAPSLNIFFDPPVFAFRHIKIAPSALATSYKRHKRELAILLARWNPHNEMKISDMSTLERRNARKSDSIDHLEKLAATLSKEQFEYVRNQFFEKDALRSNVMQSSDYDFVHLDQDNRALEIAIFKRSASEIESILRKIVHRNLATSCNGATQILFWHGRRILSDITSLENDVAIVRATNCLMEVEKFIYRCAFLGYEGPAVILARKRLNFLLHNYAERGILDDTQRLWLRSLHIVSSFILKRDVEMARRVPASLFVHTEKFPGSKDSLAALKANVTDFINKCTEIEAGLEAGVLHCQLAKIDNALLDAAAFK